METLTSPSHEDLLPMLPLDLVVEILCRLPVKFLLQFRSVCKLWNSLISDLNFAKKHLHLSATRSLNSVFYSASLNRYMFESRPLHSLFSTISMDATQTEYPPNGFDGCHCPHYPYHIVGSCNGILCLALFYDDCFVLVWNPAIRKFKELPPLEKPKSHGHVTMTHGFGYDHVSDDYKVVIVLKHPRPYVGHKICSLSKTEVKVYTFGTNLWKSIGEFPFGCVPFGSFGPPGTFVSGAINWLASKHGHRETPCLIVSFSLKNESFQEIVQPDYGEVDAYSLSLGVLRDSLCMFSNYDVWLMKEYGNKESWTKLLTMQNPMQNPSDSYFLFKVICMFTDDLVLFESSSNCDKKLIAYDLKTGIYKFVNIQNKNDNHPRRWKLGVCTESLILP